MFNGRDIEGDLSAYMREANGNRYRNLSKGDRRGDEADRRNVFLSPGRDWGCYLNKS